MEQVDYPSAEMGTRIKARRAALGLSQHDLAAQAGVGRSLLSLVEIGRSGLSAESMARMADALGVTMDWLWRGTP